MTVKNMKNILKALSILTFLTATFTVASIFYEGLVLKWFPFVKISILATDILFLIATIAGVFYYKKHKTLFFAHLLSVIILFIGVIITLTLGENMPKILFLLWEFYILYFYGMVVSRKLWQKTVAL